MVVISDNGPLCQEQITQNQLDFDTILSSVAMAL